MEVPGVDEIINFLASGKLDIFVPKNAMHTIKDAADAEWNKSKGQVYMTVLLGNEISLWKRKNPRTIGNSDLDKLKEEIVNLGSPTWRGITNILISESPLWELSYDYSKRNVGLAKKHRDILEEEEQEQLDIFKTKWLPKYLVDFVGEMYENFRVRSERGFGATEPCVTPSIIRNALIVNLELPNEYKSFSNLSTKKQLDMIRDVLKSLVRKKRLSTSLGIVEGKEVRCYEPFGYGS